MLLGVDLGTTAVKTALVTTDGRVVAAADVGYASMTGPDGRHEQEPDAWWAAVCGGLDALRAGGARLDEVRAVGLSGQTHGLVLVDGDHRPVRPCMTWADQRATSEARELAASVGARVRERCGNPTIETFTLPKLLWVARHEPEALVAARHLALPKDLVRHRLVGTWATDPTDAASTLMFDVHERAWDAELAAAAGVPGELLPDVTGSAEVAGTVIESAAAATGLQAGTPVVTGASDVACAALGAGADVPGIAYVNLGTAAQVMTPAARPPADPAYLFLGAGREPLLAMTSVYSAGVALDWFAEQFTSGRAGGARPPAAERRAGVDAAVLGVEPGSDGLLFLPYLLGASTPRPDALARGAFLGLSAAHGRAHALRAVIEGVALAIRVALDALVADGVPARRIRIGGGPTASPAWTRILCDALGAEVDVLAGGSSALGAAMLAGVATGAFADLADAADRCVTVRERLVPEVGAAAVYAGRLELFRAAYDAVLPLSRALAGGAGEAP